MASKTKLPQLPKESILLILKQLELLQAQQRNSMPHAHHQVWRELSNEETWKVICTTNKSRMGLVLEREVLLDQTRHCTSDSMQVYGRTSELGEYVKLVVGLKELRIEGNCVREAFYSPNLKDLRHLHLLDCSTAPPLQLQTVPFSFSSTLSSLSLACSNRNYYNDILVPLLRLPHVKHLSISLPTEDQLEEAFDDSFSSQNRTAALVSLNRNVHALRSFTIRGFLTSSERKLLFKQLCRLTSYTSELANTVKLRNMLSLSNLKYLGLISPRYESAEERRQGEMFGPFNEENYEYQCLDEWTFEVRELLLELRPNLTWKKLKSVALIAPREYYWYPELLGWEGGQGPDSEPEGLEPVRRYCAKAGYSLYLMGDGE